MEFIKNDIHQETSSAAASVAAADHPPKTYTVMTSTGKPLKIRFVFGKSSKNKPAASGVPTQDHDHRQEQVVLEAEKKMEIIKTNKEISINKQQQQQIIQDQEDHHHKKEAAARKDIHHQEAAKQVKVKVKDHHRTTMITVKKSIRAADDDQHYSSPPQYQAKPEASKRKLHETYQQLADAKKQRTIKVIDRLSPKSSSSSRGAAAAATGSTSTSKARGAGIRTLSSKKKKNLHHGRTKLLLPTY